MSTQDNNTLPKMWQIVDIVHHILMLSKVTTAVALARTCKSLYSSVSSYNSLWHKLYQSEFTRDINTNVGWLQWQLEQKQQATEAATSAETETAPMLTWFQLYVQRMNIGLNWQKNKSVSTICLPVPRMNRLVELCNSKRLITASYPGWIVIANCREFQISLIKLFPKNMTSVQPLNLNIANLEAIYNVAFYRYQQQANDADEDVRVILHLERTEEPVDVLEIWSVNSLQLLQTIDFGDQWDGRIVNSFLIFSKSPNNRSTQLFYSSFLKGHIRKPQLIKNINMYTKYNCILHTADSKKIIILEYFMQKTIVKYSISRVLLTPDANLRLNDDDNVQITQLGSGQFTAPNNSFCWDCKFYSIDCDRVLFYTSTMFWSMSCSNEMFYRCHIKIISISKGIILKCDHPVNALEALILIPKYELAVFYSKKCTPIVIMSLLNGEIQQHADIEAVCDRFCHFQHIIDTTIIGCNYESNQYCIVDVLAGTANVYPFLIPDVVYCKVSFKHMVLINEETMLITSFVPELV